MKKARNSKEAFELIKKAKKGDTIFFDEATTIDWNDPRIKKLLRGYNKYVREKKKLDFKALEIKP